MLLKAVAMKAKIPWYQNGHTVEMITGTGLVGEVSACGEVTLVEIFKALADL